MFTPRAVQLLKGYPENNSSMFTRYGFATFCLRLCSALLFTISIGVLSSAYAQVSDLPLNSGFIFKEAPFESAHASTVAELANGSLMAAWFGGRSEGDPSVEIWTARKPPNGSWSAPKVVTSYPQSPCWNPVLFRRDNKLWLFFKVGPSPREWVGAYRISEDEGRSWSSVHYLPAGLLGPIRTKPITLENGDILAGTSVEAGYNAHTPADAPYKSWAAWVERSSDKGRTWHKHGPIAMPNENFGVIQPTLWQTSRGHVRMLLRSTHRVNRIVSSVSKDGGKTWTPAQPTALPNPNSGIDAVKLADGRVVLAYNHTESGRTPIHVAVSSDDGATWSAPLVVEDGAGEFSYPAIIQADNGNIHLTYTWKRSRIRHVVLSPDDLPGK